MQNDDFRNGIFKTEISGVYIIKRQVFEDERGYFWEAFRKNEFEEQTKIKFDPVQVNYSRSNKGVLRGIHIAPWSKLTTVIRGEIQQVIVDLRKDSATFKRHICLTMGESNRVIVFIPPGCGNAYQALSEEVDYCYLVDQYWKPGLEYGVSFRDPEINIKWQIDPPILSSKDELNPFLKEII